MSNKLEDGAIVDIPDFDEEEEELDDLKEDLKEEEAEEELDDDSKEEELDDSSNEDSSNEDSANEDSSNENSSNEDSSNENSEDENSEDEEEGSKKSLPDDDLKEVPLDLNEEKKEFKKENNNLRLASLFRDNINKVELNKDELESLEENVNTKTDLKYYLNAVELLNAKELSEFTDKELNDSTANKNYKYLYPHLDDELFNIKIANKKEFEENKLKITIDEDFEKQSNEICNKDFELAPHQKFIKNFLSIHTPYNGLLLYHGLGTGKTCSAIGVAEETRKYLKYMGYNERIIIVASPNVQENFYLQLFDEGKLDFKNGIWTINNCAGQNILDEINLMQKNLSREKVVRIVKNVIANYYLFIGYTQFANLIIKKSNVSSNVNTSVNDSHKKKLLIKNKLQKFFNNRLIIIDEIHNIRQSQDSSNKLVSNELMNLVKNVNNLKLLFMSATPMFNDFKEIIFLINILNLNDKRSIIELKDVFNKDGSFLKNSTGEEVGFELFRRKISGYISYVKGDNPLSFPFRILPNNFSKSASILNTVYPQLKINNNPLTEKIEYFDIYVNSISPYQEFVYNIILKNNISKFDEEKINAMESFGYTLLQKPLESLNMVFPNSKLENYFNEKMILHNNAIQQVLNNINLEEINTIVNIKDIVGKSGINNIMSYQETQAPKSRYDYRYKNTQNNTQTNIFDYNVIEKYSFKIKSIMNSILGSQGPIIIYSQFIDSGLIPLALTLESLGFTRYGSNRSLFSTPPSEELDVNSYKKKSEVSGRFKGAKYVIISGNPNISPDNVSDLTACTDSNNIDGENVKVILLSAAGSEGLDFKYIRQVHILEPWYNINRVEQIVGRAIRTCSHKDLPLNKRNVQIFMHGTLLHNNTESVDLFIYRKAEEKAKIIGNVTRVLKEHSIDCILNYEQQRFDEKLLNKKLQIILSNNLNIEYAIGDKSYSPLCDYMAECSYKCKPSLSLDNEDINLFTYNQSFMQTNNEAILKILRDLFKEKYFYTKEDIIKHILTFKEYSLIHINNALDELVNNENIFIKDKYDNLGKLINIENLYIFQPINLNTDATLFERSNVVMSKQDSLKFEVPNDIQLSNLAKKDTPKIRLDNDDDNLTQDNVALTKSIIQELNNNYNYIVTSYEEKKGDKALKDNKYLSYGKIMDFLKHKEIIKGDEASILAINILLDDLDFNKTVLLVIYLLNNGYSLLTEFEKNLLTYYNSKILNTDKLKALYLPTKSEFREHTLYMLRTTNNVTLKIAEPEDYNDFDEIISNLKISEAGLAIPLGILSINKKIVKELITDFKVKTGTNKGARCSQAGKANSEKIFQSLNVEREIIELLKKFNQKEFCAAQELYFRLYDLRKIQAKRWFLNLYEAQINDLL